LQPGAGGLVWAGTSNAGVWEQRSNGLGNVSVLSLQVNPFNHNVLLAVTSNGVYRTSDGGQNWVQVTMPSIQSGWRTVFWDRANAGEVVISGLNMGDWYSPDPRAAVSYDGGQSWTGIDLDPGSSWDVVPRDVWGLDGQWYILGYSLYPGGCNRSLFWRSEDHGQTREAVCTWLDYTDWDRHVTRFWNDPLHIFGAYDGTISNPIIESINEGDVWSTGSFSIANQRQILADPVWEGVLWLAARYGLYRSQTGISGFEQVFNAGSTGVGAVAVDALPLDES
jgi:hypothetical protein